jgi:NosR/NirI family transcriptional regulator, nitrous oxide reductase regulator
MIRPAMIGPFPLGCPAGGGRCLVRLAAAVLAMAAWLVAPERADAAGETVPAEILANVFPGAERAGEFTGVPPAAVVYADGAPAGYLLSTAAVIGSVGFSGKPLDVLVGLRNDGVIAGAVLRRHDEPILIIGIPHERLLEYVAGFAGLDIRLSAGMAESPEPAPGIPDAISGATVSSLVMRDAIVRSARAVATSRGLFGWNNVDVRLDRETFAAAGWADLLSDGSIARLRLTSGAVSRALGEDGPESPESLFIDLYTGLVNPPRIGQNLLGRREFTRLTAGMGATDSAILVAASGLYSFKGTTYVRSGIFDRLQLVQGERTIRFESGRYRNIEALSAAGAPDLREIGVFTIPADTGFDPLAPWRLELLVMRQTAQGATMAADFPLEYTIPVRYRLGDEAAAAETPPAEAPLWMDMWQRRLGAVAGLSAMLGVLTVILVFQDVIAARQRLYRWTRLTFLSVTVVWLGWIAGAQLSVVNVLTFAHSLLTGFRWEFFLLDPLIFILWSYVAVAMLFWARGVFCGWLCPFGALQELLAEAARRLGLPRVQVPFALHERLWPIKYIIFLGLFAVSLNSTNLAVLGAEVEPFKTAIILKFVRHWPFVVYVLALLTAGLFIERFFCRYLCPLGAALAIPARLHMFQWLKRRHQCGRECHICAVRCPVQAIHPTGAINPNECIHCLKCQRLYYDAFTCPPLITRRKRRAERAAMSTPEGQT